LRNILLCNLDGDNIMLPSFPTSLVSQTCPLTCIFLINYEQTQLCVLCTDFNYQPCIILIHHDHYNHCFLFISFSPSVLSAESLLWLLVLQYVLSLFEINHFSIPDHFARPQFFEGASSKWCIFVPRRHRKTNFWIRWNNSFSAACVCKVAGCHHWAHSVTTPATQIWNCTWFC
jgi:hypothetical protein